jgi:cyclopropane-fatty-acyl-phospholipid synthase
MPKAGQRLISSESGIMISATAFFSMMLDRRMNYSCGYWEKATTLDQAQEAKLDLICQKLRLKPGMTVLDIGCGWGGFAGWAAEKYDVSVLGITVSQEQVKFARQACKGLDVKIELHDYRDLRDTFEHIVSIGMFEHVGSKNYKKFMKMVFCLKSDGLFLLHTIAGNTTVHTTDPWIGKYIFPNSMLPSARQISSAAERVLILEHWHSFGHYYDQTLMAWQHNFTKNWAKIKDMYDERFYRMWTYYLLSCAAGFRSRRNQVWQIVFSREGIRGGYQY